MKRVLGILCLFLLSFAMVSCGESDPYDHLNDIEFKDGFFKYDGEAKSITCENVPQGIDVEYLGNGVRNAGQHVVNANILDGGNFITRKTAMIYILAFEDTTFEYCEGETYSLEVANVPDGYEAVYEGNEQSEIGEYEVTAIIKKLPEAETTEDGEEYYDEEKKVEVFRMTATLTIVEGVSINPEDIDLSEIVFEDLSVPYDGEEHFIEAENLPEEVWADYENNYQTEIGEYDVVAIVYYEDIELTRLTAKLTIYDPNGGNQGGNDDDPTSEYYLEIGGTIIELTVNSSNTDTTCVEYMGSATVAAGDAVYAFGPKGQIYSIGDGRDGKPSTNNVIGSNDNMSILVAGTVDCYLKVYADGCSLWVTGNSEEVAPEQGGNQGGGEMPDLSQYTYVLVVNGNQYFGLTANGKAWVDGVEHEEYFAKGVSLTAGDVVTLFDVKNNAGWAITNVNPYSSGKPVGSATGITIGETGLYDIYVQFLYQNDKIYFGPAA